MIDRRSDERTKDKMRYRKELDAATRAVRQAGRIIRESYAKLEPGEVSEKRLNDLVTTVDLASQEAVVSVLKKEFPNDFIVAEENLDPKINRGLDGTTARRWYIDPLDGTTNYIHAFPVFAVSIALEESDGREIVIGITYDPMRDEIFRAVRGEGAFLNGRPIRVSTTADSMKAFFVTGFPFRSKQYLDDYLRTFRYFFTRARGIRRAGSATLDLAYVAAGRADAFWELTLSPWDMAAGILLVEEAGGKVTDFFGGRESLENGHIVASNGKFHEWMCESIQEIFPSGKTYKID
jgi:myo-inositol-1(or 4)-monophosphatase